MDHYGKLGIPRGASDDEVLLMLIIVGLAKFCQDLGAIMEVLGCACFLIFHPHFVPQETSSEFSAR